jgi:hypothetical protein
MSLILAVFERNWKFSEKFAIYLHEKKEGLFFTENKRFFIFIYLLVGTLINLLIFSVACYGVIFSVCLYSYFHIRIFYILLFFIINIIEIFSFVFSLILCSYPISFNFVYLLLLFFFFCFVMIRFIL